MKTCFKCGQGKPLSQFYKHKGMADGHLNKCKDCGKADVRANRRKNLEYYRAYDRARGSGQTAEYRKQYARAYPNKARAHRKVAYHLRAGNLHPEPCEVCGAVEHVHAHHDDYLQPLNVRWLCAAHHREWHDKHGPGANP